MNDKVLEGFLEDSQRRVAALAAASDTLTVLAQDGQPARRYLCAFEDVEHLVRGQDGAVKTSCDPLLVEIRIPHNYLRSVDPDLGMHVVGIVAPIFHPNIRPPALCLGSAFRAGTPVAEILRMVYELISFQMVTPDERDAFNPEACRFVREHPDMLRQLRIPPLRRRRVASRMEVCEAT